MTLTTSLASCNGGKKSNAVRVLPSVHLLAALGSSNEITMANIRVLVSRSDTLGPPRNGEFCIPKDKTACSVFIFPTSSEGQDWRSSWLLSPSLQLPATLRIHLFVSFLTLFSLRVFFFSRFSPLLLPCFSPPSSIRARRLFATSLASLHGGAGASESLRTSFSHP